MQPAILDAGEEWGRAEMCEGSTRLTSRARTAEEPLLTYPVFAESPLELFFFAAAAPARPKRGERDEE